jgi:hypothetical protein
MTSSESSKDSTAPENWPPRFFADRCMGVLTVNALRASGWDIVRISDVFEDDAQTTSDEVWVAYAGRQGWAGLTKDKKIRRQVSYRQAQTPIFALSSGNLGIPEMVNRFETARDRIWANAVTRRREFWVVYEGGRIERRDP